MNSKFKILKAEEKSQLKIWSKNIEFIKFEYF